MCRWPRSTAGRSGAETINEAELDVVEELKVRTGGRGPDVCIDAVGMEAHGKGIADAFDRIEQALRLESGQPYALREAIRARRKGGTVSLAGVHAGFADKLPLGTAFNNGLTFRMGQTHVQRYMRSLLDRIERGEIDPTLVITHHLPLEEGPHVFQIFHKEGRRLRQGRAQPMSRGDIVRVAQTMRLLPGTPRPVAGTIRSG